MTASTTTWKDDKITMKTEGPEGPELQDILWNDKDIDLLHKVNAKLCFMSQAQGLDSSHVTHAKYQKKKHKGWKTMISWLQSP